MEHTAFKDKRADSIVPEAFFKQRPRRDMDGQKSPLTPPSSPPHNAYNSADEGEGEAIFAGTPLSQSKGPRRSPTRTDDFDDDIPLAKKAKSELAGTKNPPPRPPPPPPPPKNKDSKPGQPRPPPPPPPPPRRQSSVTPPPPQNPAPPSTSVQNHSPSTTSDVSSKASPPTPGPVAVNVVPPAARLSSRPKQVPVPSLAASVPPPSEQQEHRRSSPIQGSQVTMDIQSPDKKPNVDLPAGWICVWSKSQKRWYFFNTKSNKSVWQWPPPP